MVLLVLPLIEPAPQPTPSRSYYNIPGRDAGTAGAQGSTGLVLRMAWRYSGRYFFSSTWSQEQLVRT